MDISIIICTYNRAHNLADCVSHLMRQDELNGIDWEVVIVDNNSTDTTKTVVRELQANAHHPIRYQFEPNQGLSYARNCGILSCRSEYIVFIDDDILVTPGWLRSIHSAFVHHNSDAVGGRISVSSPDKIPGWISSDMLGFLGHLDYGDAEFSMDGVKFSPFGGNMAFKRSVFERIGLFDTRMGRKGEGRKADELLKGEEIDLFERLASIGGRIDYVPAALVYHKILPHQLQKKFFRTLHYMAGYLKAQTDEQVYDKYIFGVPRFLLGQTFRAIVKYLKELMSGGVSNSFRLQMNIGYFLGMMAGYRKRPRASLAK